MPSALRSRYEALIHTPPPREEVEDGLRRKQRRAHLDYLRAHRRRRGQKPKMQQAILDIGLVALAYDELEGAPLDVPRLLEAAPWQPRAKRDLLSFIEEKPAARAFLMDGIYFQENNATARLLKFTVEAAVSPSHYEGYTLAAGVATDLIVAKRYLLHEH